MTKNQNCAKITNKAAEDQTVPSNFVVRILQRFPENVRSVIATCLLGFAAGIAAVGFLFLTNLLFSITFLQLASRSPLFFASGSLVVITVTSLIVGFLLHVFSPEAAGSGIPQVKTAYWKELGHMKIKPVLIKFIAGVLSIGGGNSLGREGPTVYIGSGVASCLHGFFGTPARRRRGASLIGASAGLAAAFNTPLAAITFVIEEILGDLNSRNLGPVVLSSVIGALTVHALLGRHPAFSMPVVENISWWHYLVVPVVALVAAGAGVIFQRITIFARERIRKQKLIPGWLQPAVGGILTWIIGAGIFLLTRKIGVFGLGYQDLSRALNNNFPWQAAGIMAIAKLLAMTAGYSYGGCGGIFAPSLFIGGMSGYFLGGLTRGWLPLTPADQLVLAAVGMSACLGAIVRAPLTSMLIVFEMTHQFALVPALMLGAIISQAVSRRASAHNFYDALLVQEGHKLHKIRPPMDIHGWQNLPIEAVANPHPVGLHSLADTEMRGVLENYPFQVFPVFEGDKVKGIVTRQQIQDALKDHKEPEIQKMGYCFSDQTIKEVGNTFIESSIYVLIVLDRKTRAVSGIITLHDLIRAQAALQQ